MIPFQYDRFTLERRYGMCPNLFSVTPYRTALPTFTAEGKKISTVLRTSRVQEREM